MDFEDQTVLVTGAGSGIGRATAVRFADEGATVLVTDIEPEPGTETVKEITRSGGSAEFHPLDVRDQEAFGALLESVAEQHGLDVLVNNAGVATRGRLDETTAEERDRLIDVNLKGTWNGCRESVPHLTNGGAIVNVSSISGLLGTPYFASYALTKAAILNLTQSLAWEVGTEGIRVNAVCPGTVDTPMARQGFDQRDDPDAVRAAEASAHALGRLAQPEEVAACIAFLASDDASFVTGHGLVVDGGYSAVTRPYE